MCPDASDSSSQSFEVQDFQDPTLMQRRYQRSHAKRPPLWKREETLLEMSVRTNAHLQDVVGADELPRATTKLDEKLPDELDDAKAAEM